MLFVFDSTSPCDRTRIQTIHTLKFEDTLDDAGNLAPNSLPQDLFPNRAEVDLSRIRNNLDVMRRHAGGGPVMAVVKADAYGHGAIRVARALESHGVEFLAVAQVQEAVELRLAGLERPILVMGVPRKQDLPVLADMRLDILIHSPEWARTVADFAGRTRELSVHLKVDTGMHRLGMRPEDVAETISTLESAPGIRLAGLWTHFASADDPESSFTAKQYDVLRGIVQTFGDRFDHVHVRASNAVHYHRDVASSGESNLIRIGISLYGYLHDSRAARDIGLEPAMRMISRVAQTRVIEAGEGVSYNLKWTAKRRTQIATISCGYADGYFRALSNKAEVGIHGKRFPVVGTVCMDLTMVNLGEPGSIVVQEGDRAIMFGDGGPSAYEVARWADTIVYEVCTNVSRRVRRVYKD